MSDNKAINQLRTDIALYNIRNKNKTEWTNVEVMWFLIFYVEPKYSINTSLFPYEHYVYSTGQELLNRSLEEFKTLDTQYGEIVYDEFHKFNTDNNLINYQNSNLIQEINAENIAIENDSANDESESSGDDNDNSRILMWMFCRNLLQSPQTNPSVIEWLNKRDLVFKINNPTLMAFMWGRLRNNVKMKYDIMARGIRHGRSNHSFERPDKSVYKTRYVHQFGERAVNNCPWLQSLRNDNV